MKEKNVEKALRLGFEAQARLIMIHPWQDGNKRTSRLLTNYIEKKHNIPLTKVHKEDIAGYIGALKIFKDTKNIEPFMNFMLGQHVKTLQKEIDMYRQAQLEEWDKIIGFTADRKIGMTNFLENALNKNKKNKSSKNPTEGMML